MPHLMSERSRVVLGRVRFCTPMDWLGMLESTSDMGEDEVKPDTPMISWLLIILVSEPWLRIIFPLDCDQEVSGLLLLSCRGSLIN